MELSIYDNAKHWVNQYESIDEVKDIIDKAAAIKEYAKRSNDYELEHQAARARVRAEKRAGELLSETQKAQGKRTDLTLSDSAIKSEFATVLESSNISIQTASKWQQLAKVPEEEFEEALADKTSAPSAHAILKAREHHEPGKRINEDCLYLWGRLIDIEKKLLNKDINYLLGEMTPAMRKDSERILPLLLTWLEEYL